MCIIWLATFWDLYYSLKTLKMSKMIVKDKARAIGITSYLVSALCKDRLCSLYTCCLFCPWHCFKFFKSTQKKHYFDVIFSSVSETLQFHWQPNTILKLYEKFWSVYNIRHIEFWFSVLYEKFILITNKLLNYSDKNLFLRVHVGFSEKFSNINVNQINSFG